jgi:hypothetical protein
MVMRSVHNSWTTCVTEYNKLGVQTQGRGGVYVFPLAAVLLNSLAFSRAEKPGLVCELTVARPNPRRTVLNEHLLVIDDADVLPGQVTDLTTLHFPKFVCNLRNQSCAKSLSCRIHVTNGKTYGNREIRSRHRLHIP